MTDPNGRTTTYGYDAANHRTSVTTPTGAATTFSYDALGRLVTRIDANGHVTTFTYDASGNLSTTARPGGATTSYSYDSVGNRVSQTDPNGVITQFTYDAANRTTAVDYSDSTPDVSYSYDAAGRRTSMTDGTGQTTYAYDADGHLTSRTHGSDTFTYSYDAAGNVTSRKSPDGLTAAYAYDADGRATTLSTGAATLTYTYDADSNPTGTTYPGSVGEASTWNATGTLASSSVKHSSTALFTAGYTYDAADNPIAVTGTNPRAYTYDADGRITSACYSTSCPTADTTYTYDGVGNRLTETESGSTTTSNYNSDDELTSTTGAASATATYDDDGRQLTKGGTTYTYNAAGDLTSVTNGSTTTTYTYDGDGNRATSTTAGTTITYLWDTNWTVPRLAEERDQTGTVQRTWLNGPDTTDGVLLSNGSYHWLQHDGLGSTVAVTDNSGTQEWAFGYDAYGKAEKATKLVSTAPSVPIRFADEYLDATGLYNLRARAYDPAAGSFTSRDPLEGPAETPAESAYVYASSRPTVYTDPTGMFSMLEAIGFGRSASSGGMAAQAVASVQQDYINAGQDPRSAGLDTVTQYASNFNATQRFASNTGELYTQLLTMAIPSVGATDLILDGLQTGRGVEALIGLGWKVKDLNDWRETLMGLFSANSAFGTQLRSGANGK